jgi:hypothetical protein
LTITETELKLIAAAAIIGLNRIPKNEYKTPGSTVMPQTGSIYATVVTMITGVNPV